MPLSFKSESHGNIAFGFFNIESDMLLLENYFFFADEFCQLIDMVAKKSDNGQKQFQFKVYYITDPQNIGDLMGAIHNVRFTGFIGNIYKLFPFPEDPDAFKQNPEGYKTQDIVKEQIEDISEQIEIKIEFFPNSKIHIGSYTFNISVFHELIRYVDQGGYPRWKDEIRPGYVVQMKEGTQKSSNSFFKGIFAS
jgi:hypothetical protein